MCFLAFVYFFWNAFLGFLVASIMDRWQPFCNSRLSPVWPNHLRLAKMMDVRKWTKIFGQCDVRPQLMQSKLNSKNAVGITEKCRSQTNCAVVRLKATFSAKSAVFEVLGCSRYVYFTCSSVHSWESAEFLYMSDSSYSPPKKSGVQISFLPTCSMVLEYWPTFALKITQFCR